MATTEPRQSQPLDVAQLQQELQLRDQLVQQLSQELFRLVKGNDDPAPELEAQHQEELQRLREQF